MHNKTVLVTGGTGSFGSKFCKNVLLNYKVNKLIIFSRDELKQYNMSELDIFKKNKKKVRFFIGDVRDKDRLFTALNNVNIVVHAAALKQVNTAEYNPFETIKTNVHGAENIIQASLANNVEKVIALSTDKASSPINLYGASKLLSDKLFVSSNTFKGNKKTKFSVVRYGNVFGSRGSVAGLFLEERKKNLFSVTNKDMTRFSITLDEAVYFVERCIKIMKGGEIFVPKIPSYRLMDLVKAFSANPKIKLIGLRPGEKLHEEMISVYDSPNTVESKDYFSIYSSIDKNLKKNMTFCKKGFTYSSKDNPKFLTISQIQKLISHL